tara:strand:+ start:89 stop:898 length:810 start_codon:yes stop_codon:yes gene_type:complete
MKLFTNKKKLQKELKDIKNISFVPTMGSLHKGHESIIKKSVNESRCTLVSIFINPKQFENEKDLKNYPKNIKKDMRILKKLKVDYVYKPSYKDIYNFKTKNKIYIDKFSKKLCGKFRRNHFKGVLDVVNRFIEIIKPQKILLGSKDFQQLFLINKHIKKNKINTKVIQCKTVRDSDFIAFSSRLLKLKNYEKRILSKAIDILRLYKKNLIKKKLKYDRNSLIKILLSLGVKKVDYVEIINLKTLKKPKTDKFNIFFALYVGKIRFIDNF